MSRTQTSDAVAEERPELLIFCGGAGLIGNIAPLATMAFAVPIAQHDFIADTISDLGRGPHAWIMDTGLYLNAAAMLSLSIAAAHWHLDRVAWSVGIICLALIALTVTLLGIWDEFGEQAPGVSGVAVHTAISFALAPLYVAAPLCMIKGVSRITPLLKPVFIVSALGWIVFAVWFKLAPDAYDGLMEKIAVGFTMLFTLPLAFVFLRRGMSRRTA